MATPRTGRRRGRPTDSKKDFRTDPDRVAVAVAWVLMEGGGRSENSAYTTAALFYALPIALSVNQEGPGLTLTLDSLKGLPDDPEHATRTRLRKKGRRWRDDPEARAYIENLMMDVAMKAAIHQDCENKEERIARVRIDVKAL